MNSKILSIHGGHNSSTTFVDKNNQIRIFELERYTKIKNDTFEYDIFEDDDRLPIKKKFLKYVKTQLKEEPKFILYSYLSEKYLSLIKKYFQESNFVLMGHHTSHCIGAYQQSGFKDALVISMDAGGKDYSHYGITDNEDGCEISYSILNISDKKVDVIQSSDFSDAMVFTPGCYTAIAPLISEINIFESNSDIDKFYEYLMSGSSATKDESPFWKMRTKSCISAGKLMGLSAYGNVRTEWIDLIKKLYLVNSNESSNPLRTQMMMIEVYNIFGRYIKQNCLSGQESYDLVSTNQYVFEELCFELIKTYIDNSEFDVVFSGGCALNVLFNQRISKYLKEKNRKLFVSPTPSDEGISYGHCCSIDIKMKDKFSVYSGLDILDRDKIPKYYDRYNKVGKVIKIS